MRLQVPTVINLKAAHILVADDLIISVLKIHKTEQIGLIHWCRTLFTLGEEMPFI